MRLLESDFDKAVKALMENNKNQELLLTTSHMSQEKVESTDAQIGQERENIYRACYHRDISIP